MNVKIGCEVTPEAPRLVDNRKDVRSIADVMLPSHNVRSSIWIRLLIDRRICIRLTGYRGNQILGTAAGLEQSLGDKRQRSSG
jgi:hypothetical protein